MTITIYIIKILFQVFFVLRKKENLVTFLHVFHHAIVPLLAWILFRTEKSNFLLPYNLIKNIFVELYNNMLHVSVSIETITERNSLNSRSTKCLGPCWLIVQSHVGQQPTVAHSLAAQISIPTK